jgi:hypothetical protein
MRQINKWSLIMLATATLTPATIAFAQGPGYGPPGGFPGGGPQGGFQGGPPNGFFQVGGFLGGQNGGPASAPEPAMVSAVTTPISTLTSALTLTQDQQSQIQAIQSDFRQDVGEVTPRPAGFGQQYSRPAPPDSATRAKLKDIDSKESALVMSILTPEQTASLTTLLSQLKEMAAAQIPTRLFSQLNLTTDQYNQIAKIETAEDAVIKQAVTKAATDSDYDDLEQSLADSHWQVHTKALAVLTSTQAALVTSSQERGGFRGPQAFQSRGFGGPQQGGQFGAGTNGGFEGGQGAPPAGFGPNGGGQFATPGVDPNGVGQVAPPQPADQQPDGGGF